METESGEKMSTGMELSNKFDLLDDPQKVQTETNEITESKSQEDLQKLSVNEATEDVNETPIDTNAEDSDGEITSDNKNIDDLLTEMKVHMKKCKEATFTENILDDELLIFSHFFNLVEAHEKKFTKQDISILRRAIKRFIHAVNGNYSNELRYYSDSSRKIFYKSFNLINFATVQNYLKNLETSNDLKMLTCPCVNRILTIICQALINSNLGLNDDERPSNYIQLLSSMSSYITTDLESSDLSVDSSATDASITRWWILEFLQAYSDQTVLVQDLIQSGYLQIIAKELSTINKTENVNDNPKEQIISTIYNISRHDESVTRFDALNTVDEIKLFQSNNDNTHLNTVCSMILILLSTSEQINEDQEHVKNILDRLFEIVHSVSFWKNYKNDVGFHVSEPLVVLVKLFNAYDRLFGNNIEHSQIKLYTSINLEYCIHVLINYYHRVDDTNPLKPVTCATLIHVLWHASFQDEYKQLLKNTSTTFQEIIENLAKESTTNIAHNQYIPKYINNIQQSAQGLISNIDGFSKEDNQSTLNTISTLTPDFDQLAKEKPTGTELEESHLDQRTTMEQTVYPNKPIEQWHKSDISQWFQSNGIRSELRDLCRFQNGDELLTYAQLFLDTEKLQYQMYSDEFSRRNGITSGKKPLLLHEFTKFSNALRKLEKISK